MENIEKYIGIVETQQNSLRFQEFTYTDAFSLGISVVERAKMFYEKPVAVRIDIDGVTVFYHLMEGTSLNNDWWMKKKLNGCMKTKESSFMNFLKIRASNRFDEFPWSKDEGSFALVGGCFPIVLLSGEQKGFLMVSGLPHPQDHQLMVDTLADVLDTEVPTILDGGSFEV